MKSTSEFHSYFDELESAFLYAALAAYETDPIKQKLFSSLGAAATEQSEIWARKIREQNKTLPSYRPSVRVRIVRRLLLLLGPRAIFPVLAAMKVRGISIYKQSDSKDSEHPHPHPERQHWLSKGGGNLRASVFGINDGLCSNASLILGIAGASNDNKIILTTGVAGLLAGAFSMAAGEYISMRTQRDLFEHQIGLEKKELEEYPEEEASELALIYEAKGVPAKQAKEIANHLIKDPAKALDTLAREELGLNPEELGSPWGAAFYSFVSFALGAILPLAPFLFLSGGNSLIVSILASAIALFLIGAILSLFTGRNALLGGVRMLFVGTLAGSATFIIGRSLGVALG